MSRLVEFVGASGVGEQQHGFDHWFQFSLRSDAGLKSRLARYREFDLDTSDIYGLVTEIHSVKAPVIAFIGYPELALELLEELKERDNGGQKLADYTFILSEVCFTDELLNFDPAIKLYVTSFVKPIEDLRCSVTFPSVRSQEAEAFDAVMILASVARDCKDKHRGCPGHAIASPAKS